MTTGVRLTRLGRNRGRNLFAEYGAPKKPQSVSEAITSGNTSESGQIAYAGMQLVGSIFSAYLGGGRGGSSNLSMQVGLTVIADMTPLGALFGSLFGVKNTAKIYGKEYSEFQLFNSKYGIPINEGDGNIRLAGNVIWTTKPKERIIRMEQKVSDAPDTFVEYRSRTGVSNDFIFSRGAQYEQSYNKYYTYYEYHYPISFAVAFANIKNYAGKIVRIWADKEVIWDVRDSNLNEPTQLMSVGMRDSDFHTFYKDTIVTVYDGTQTTVDPTIHSVHGINTPTYEHTCYAVFKNLDLNDFNGRIPIIEAEIAFRSEPVKYKEGMDYGPYGSDAYNYNVGWVHDTTDEYIQATDTTPYYYDIDIYDCVAFRSPKLYHGGVPFGHGGSDTYLIHGTKYGFISYGSGEAVFYFDRRKSKTGSWKVLDPLSAFAIPNTAVYNYFRQMGDAVAGVPETKRRVVYAYGLFGHAIAKSWIFDEGFQDMGWIIADKEPVATENPIVTLGYNNQAGGINTLGEYGGLVLDRSGMYRTTFDYGPFGSHGPPTVLWNTEFMGEVLPVESPLYSKETIISETGSAGILTLLEDQGVVEGVDPKENAGLLLIQAGGKLYHFNTHLDQDLNYVGITKVSATTFSIPRLASEEFPMCGKLPHVGQGYGGLVKMIDCISLELIGDNWQSSPYGSVPLYQNPNGIVSPSGPPANSSTHWFTANMMTATHYLNSPFFMCKHRYSTANPTLAEVVTEIIVSKIPYISSADLDVSTLTDIVRGYMMADTSDIREFLERLRKGYFFDVTESGGKLKFIKRGIVGAPIDIEESLLIDPPKAIVQSIQDLAKEGVLNYADIDFDYLQSTQRHRREQSKSLNLIENTLPIVFNANEASRVAYIYINGSYSESIELQTTLDRKYTYLDCGDIISIGEYNRLRITNLAHLEDGSLEVQAVTEDASIYNKDIPGVAIIGYESSRRLSSSRTKALTFEVPYLKHQIDDTEGYVYITAFKRFYNRPIAISVSLDSESFQYIGTPDTTKYIGRTVTRLLPPNYSIKHGSWDWDNYIDVFIQYGNPPVSATKAEVYLGANKILVGREVISFITVEQLGSNKYRLSGLLRGRDNTELYTRSHTSGEYVIELYEDIPRLIISEQDIGKPLFIHTSDGFKTEVHDAVVINGISLVPVAPANVLAEYSGNDIVVSWNKRNSASGELIPYEDIPTGNIASYSVDILANDMSVLRTITSLTTSAIYTEANQIADFGSVQEQISIVVYQHTTTLKGFGAYRNINLVTKKYYTNFSNEVVGVQPSDITIVQGNYITALPILNSYGNKELELDSGSTIANSIIKFDAIPSLADADVRFKFSYDTFYNYSENTLLIIYLKGTDSYITIDSNGSITCSMVGITNSVSNANTESFSISPLAKHRVYNVRVEYYEEIVRMKIWDTIEPSNWLFEYFPEIIGSQTDFTFNISGYFGLGTYTRNAKIYIKDIEINELY